MNNNPMFFIRSGKKFYQFIMTLFIKWIPFTFILKTFVKKVNMIKDNSLYVEMKIQC